ncbi:MAG TPA: BrnT family toxin [Duganella sp.]|nr:BrnT family toxin [Duganella sp.]
MFITFDPLKRDRTLAERGLDFADAWRVFAGPTVEMPDTRKNCGEQRTICYGVLENRMVVVIYAQRGKHRRIISMRKANEREKSRIAPALGL